MAREYHVQAFLSDTGEWRSVGCGPHATLSLAMEDQAGWDRSASQPCEWSRSRIVVRYCFPWIPRPRRRWEPA